VEGEDEDAGGQPALDFAQEDVRGLRPANAATRSGIDVLLEENRPTADEIDRVITAGASGTYLPSRPDQQLSRDLLDQLGYNPK
jgi:uncharacterized 2Fe-2S/4Fe-4S cluster protein (DUF4445 family)